jgi:YVTN family beta-propeller protein
VQIDDKICRICVFLLILKIMILAPVVIVSNNAFAQTLHDQTLYEVVKQRPGLDENAQIDVGKTPVDTVRFLDTVYVANAHSNTVSVISTENNTKIKDIPVGDGPGAIGVDEIEHTVYVANLGSNTVSVISTENNTKIKDIPVGDSPTAIGVDQDLGTAYVANFLSDDISVIDGTASEVVAGITFQVNPFNSGYIVCDDPTTTSPNDLTPPSPIRQYIYVYSGTQCTAKPNPGFEFVSWEENLPGNSTQLLNVSRPASPLASIAGFFGPTPDEPEAKLNVTKFGTFSANFKELPPAFPPEYLIPLYGIIASTIIGWSIPSIIGWARSKKDVRKLNYYHKQIASIYGDGKLDEDDIERLDQLTSSVIDAYSEGKINEKHYESLKNEISILYEEIFRKKIGLLDNNNPSNNKATQKQLSQIRNEVENAYSKGKISEKHYDLLNKAISNLESKEE